MADRRLNSVKSAGRHVSAEPTGLTTALCVHTWEYQMVLTYSVQSWVIWGIHQARKLTYTLTRGVVARKSEVSPFSKKVKKFLPFCTPACWVIHLPPRCWSAHSYSLGPCHPHLVRSGVQELSVCAPWPRSRPHGFSLPGQAGVQAVSASGKQSSRAGQLHHTWRMRNPRRSGSAAQATATLAAAVHRRLRQPAARARSPGRLVGSLPPPLLLLGAGTSRVRAGAEKPSPCARLGGGRRGQSRGTGASKGVGSAELGAARPPCPGLPGLPTLSPVWRLARLPKCARC